MDFAQQSPRSNDPRLAFARLMFAQQFVFGGLEYLVAALLR